MFQEAIQLLRVSTESAPAEASVFDRVLIMATVAEQVQPLCQGDNLDRDEFMRRWEALPEIKKAELIGGIVYMPSPILVDHGDADVNVAGWLMVYEVATPGRASGHNTTAYLLDAVPQPDLRLVSFRTMAGHPGLRGNSCTVLRSWWPRYPRQVHPVTCTKSWNFTGTPTSRNMSRFCSTSGKLRWHVLEGREYQVVEPDGDGIHRSRTFPGLWLDKGAFLQGDMRKVLDTLEEGLGSPEHQEFVRRLEQARAARSTSIK
jgi:hypothetical protein